MKIGNKLLAGFFLATGFGMAVGTIGVINTTSMASRTQLSYDSGVVPVQTIARIQETFLTIQIWLRDYIEFYGKELEQTAAGTIRQLRPKLDKYMEEYAATLVDEDEKTAFQEFKQLYDENFVTTLDKILNLLSARKLDEVKALMSDKMSPTVTRLTAKLTKMINSEQAAVKSMTDASVADSTAASSLMISLVLLSTILSVVIGLSLSRSISRPLGATVGIAQRISAGDLTVETQVKGIKRKDEIGSLLRAMHSMVLGLKDSIRAVRDTGQDLGGRTIAVVSQMKEAVDSINSVVGQVDAINQRIIVQDESVSHASGTTQQILLNLDGLNAIIEDQAANVTESSASIEEMISNIQSVMSSIDLMGKAFSTLETVANDGQAKLKAMVGTVQEVTAQSQRLQEANTIIKSISAKTNLLAMNAAIEAAHAGDKGKGFAVVADEIRKLAELSAAQSKEISNDIKLIQNKINSVSNASTTAHQSFGSIMEQIGILGRFESEIRSAMQEQSEGSQQVLEATSQINDITVKVRSGSMDMVAGSRAISEQMGSLRQASQDIKDGMAGINADSNRMKAVLAVVEQTVAKNEESAQLLAEEVSQFMLDESVAGQYESESGAAGAAPEELDELKISEE